MVEVAGGVASVLQINIAQRVALRQFAAQIALLLLRVGVADEPLFAFKIKRNGVALIIVLPHGKDGRSRELLRSRVAYPRCMNDAAVHVDMNALALEVHVLIFHVRRTIKIGRSAARIIHHRVLGREVDGRFDAILLLPIERVKMNRVVDGLIVPIDGALQRVHLRGVHSHARNTIPRQTIFHCSRRRPTLLALFEQGIVDAGHDHQHGEQKSCNKRKSSHWAAKLAINL